MKETASKDRAWVATFSMQWKVVSMHTLICAILMKKYYKDEKEAINAGAGLWEQQLHSGEKVGTRIFILPGFPHIFMDFIHVSVL